MAKNGIFTFDDALIIAAPGDTIQIKVSVDSVITTKLQRAFPDF